MLYWAILIMILLWGLFFDRYSFYHRYKVSREFKKMEMSNNRITAQNDSLKQKNYLLKTSPDAVEKIAREKLGHIKPGEKVYRFITTEDDSLNDTHKKKHKH